MTARTGSPSGISPPSRSRDIAARILLPRTIWATRPPCGSPPCTRAARRTAARYPMEAAVSSGHPTRDSGVLQHS